MSKALLPGLLMGLTACAPVVEQSLARPAKPHPGDFRLMWETAPTGHGSERASSPRAIDAAERVFHSVSLIGLSRPEVVRLLGDPRRASDSMYNFPFYPVKKNMLVYRFDTGAGGWQFDLSLDGAGRVTKVTPRGIE